MQPLFGRFKNQIGFTLVEMLIALTIMSLVLSAAYITYTKQQTLVKTQNEGTATRAQGRLALETLAKELRKAGYGFPAGQGITSANNTAITFRTNTDNINTWLRSDISSGDVTFTVSSGSAGNFSINDQIAIFTTTNTSNFETAIIQSVDTGADTLTVSSGFANSYSSSDPVLISKYHQIVVSLASGQITKEDDGGNTAAASTTTTLVDDITANGFDLDYFDNSNAEITAMPVGTTSNIRKMEIYLQLQDPDDSSSAFTQETEVNLRNMGS